jgi:hypothetical protein
MGEMIQCWSFGTQFQGHLSVHTSTPIPMVSRLSISQLTTIILRLWEMMSHRPYRYGIGQTRRRKAPLSLFSSSTLKSSRISTGLSSIQETLKKLPQTAKKECCFSLGSQAYPHSNTTHQESKRRISVVKKNLRLSSLRPFSFQTKRWQLLVPALVICSFGTAP